MAIGQVVTTVLDVGQGQSTFTCIYDNSSTPVLLHTLLFDCGSDKKSDFALGNIRHIAETLKGMAKPKLDLLVFSHSDSDHVNLMQTVVDEYNAIKIKDLEIGSVWYAGEEAFYTKRSKNILYNLDELCEEFTTPDFSESQYDKKTGKWEGQIWADPATIPTVKVTMLIGNVIDDSPGVLLATDFGTTAEKKNRVSIVCALFHGDQSILICGDATNRTLAWVNDAFGTKVLNNNLMVTVPHHGSRATGLEVSSGQAADKKAIDVVKRFVEVSNAKTATISAFQKHEHPSLEMVNYFTGKLATTQVTKDLRLTTGHFSLFNVDIALTLNTVSVPERYYTLTTSSNIYTTNYYGAAPAFTYQFTGNTVTAADTLISPAAINTHACWAFATWPDGSRKMIGYAYMPPSSTTQFTAAGVIPTMLADGVTGRGDILDEKTGALRSIETVFSDAPLPEAPTLSLHVVGAGASRRLRTFR